MTFDTLTGNFSFLIHLLAFWQLYVSLNLPHLRTGHRTHKYLCFTGVLGVFISPPIIFYRNDGCRLSVVDCETFAMSTDKRTITTTVIITTASRLRTMCDAEQLIIKSRVRNLYLFLFLTKAHPCIRIPTHTHIRIYVRDRRHVTCQPDAVLFG